MLWADLPVVVGRGWSTQEFQTLISSKRVISDELLCVALNEVIKILSEKKLTRIWVTIST
jgi:hypothetical protein